MAKIYRVVKIKLNQLIKENVHMFTDLQQSVFKHYHSDRHLSEDKKFLVDNTNIHCKPTELRILLHLINLRLTEYSSLTILTIQANFPDVFLKTYS